MELFFNAIDCCRHRNGQPITSFSRSLCIPFKNVCIRNVRPLSFFSRFTFWIRFHRRLACCLSALVGFLNRNVNRIRDLKCENHSNNRNNARKRSWKFCCAFVEWQKIYLRCIAWELWDARALPLSTKHSCWKLIRLLAAVISHLQHTQMCRKFALKIVVRLFINCEAGWMCRIEWYFHSIPYSIVHMFKISTLFQIVRIPRKT